MPADTALKWLLRLIGGVELCAVPFVLVPVSWMAAVHDRVLGLGPLPPGAVVEYMARGLSALYAVHGAMIVRLSFDLDRYRPLVRFLGGAHVALGLAVFGTDLDVGLPWYWVAVEGPVVIASGAIILILARPTARQLGRAAGPWV